MSKFLNGLYRIAVAYAVTQNPMLMSVDSIREILNGEKEV